MPDILLTRSLRAHHSVEKIMSIRRTLLPVIACCLAISSIGAQSSRPARSRTAVLAALQLTESQKARVDAIHDRYSPAVKAVQKQASDSASRITDREMAEVRSLLSGQQQQTFDSFMSGKQRAKRGRVAKVMPVRIAVPR
jgi:hypothetical protein